MRADLFGRLLNELPFEALDVWLPRSSGDQSVLLVQAGWSCKMQRLNEWCVRKTCSCCCVDAACVRVLRFAASCALTLPVR
jgi:hypothetical protein